MHNPEYSPSTNLLEVKFSSRLPQYAQQPKVIDLIEEKIANNEYFYGIEITARSCQVLDYDRFSVMPLFTSLVWLLNYSDVESVDNVESVHLANRLMRETVVVPHFTAYKLTDEKLRKYLALNFSNTLALRGNDVMQGQKYRYGAELVREIRKIRGGSISIGVGAYPQGHPQAVSMDADINFLKEKVDSGADFIITQICFEVDVLVDFIERLRKGGITVPIVVGIYIPESYQKMLRMIEIIEIPVSDDVLHEYGKRAKHKGDFQAYARQMAEQMIEAVFNSPSIVRGVHFFTVNNFKSTEEVVESVIQKYAIKRTEK